MRQIKSSLFTILLLWTSLLWGQDKVALDDTILYWPKLGSTPYTRYQKKNNPHYLPSLRIGSTFFASPFYSVIIVKKYSYEILTQVSYFVGKLPSPSSTLIITDIRNQKGQTANSATQVNTLGIVQSSVDIPLYSLGALRWRSFPNITGKALKDSLAAQLQPISLLVSGAAQPKYNSYFFDMSRKSYITGFSASKKSWVKISFERKSFQSIFLLPAGLSYQYLPKSHAVKLINARKILKAYKRDPKFTPFLKP